MSYDAVRERVIAGIDEALEAAEDRGGAWQYGFALHGGVHPATFDQESDRVYHHLPVFWLVSQTGEAVPYIGDMVAALCRGAPRPVLLQGTVHCSMRPWLLTEAFEPCRDLLLDLLVLPWGQTSNLHHRSILTARVEAKDVDPATPLIFVTTTRPSGWP